MQSFIAVYFYNSVPIVDHKCTAFEKMLDRLEDDDLLIETSNQ